MMTIGDFEAEVLHKEPLRFDAARHELARRALDYFHLKGRKHIKPRANESSTSFAGRPKRSVGLTRSAVAALTQHLYNPGPTRRHEDPRADEVLQSLYQANQINSLLSLADAWSTLHGAVGVCLTATPDQPKRLARLDLFGGHELAVWTPSDDPGTPIGVCAVGWSCRSEEWTYTIWTADERRVYRGKQGKTPKKIEEGPNPYGVLPFAFLHLPGVIVSDFWEGGLGEYLSEANAEIDRELSDSAQQAQAAVPIGYLRNTNLSQQLIIQAGYFNRLLAGTAGAPPEIGYAQAQWDAGSAMAGVEAYVYLALELVGVPRSSVRLDLSQGISGIAVVMEQLPLLTRATQRQPHAARFESELASMVLRCLGSFYRRPELIRAADLTLRLQWPELRLPVPMPEKDEASQWLLDLGLISPLMIAQERFGLTRDEAIRHLTQVKADGAELFEPPSATSGPELPLAEVETDDDETEAEEREQEEEEMIDER